MKSILQISYVLLALAFPHISWGAVNQVGEKPNFIVIMADDLGYGDLSCYGAPVIRTPVLDRMADEGARFTDFYAAAAQCTPTRAAFLTGSYPQRINTHLLFGASELIGLNPDEITFPEILQSVGYRTGVIGKWHLGTGEPFQPINHGFDYFYGFLHPEYFAKEKRLIHLNQEVIETGPETTEITDTLTAAAVAFIKRNREEPFFLFLSHDMPHIPLELPEERWGISEAGYYGDVIEHLDATVGEILECLKENGLTENTIVIFTSDNGPAIHWGVEGGSAGPFRGSKHNTGEGGFRVPFIVWGPGYVSPGKTIREVATIMDLYPTFVDWAGGVLPTDRVIDGRDIRPLLQGDESADTPHEAFFYYQLVKNGALIEGVRRGKWKLRIPLEPAHRVAVENNISDAVLRGYAIKRNEPFPTMSERREAIEGNNRWLLAEASREEVGLYDLKADPAERINLADEYPEIVNELTALMKEFDQSLRADSRPVGRVQ